MTKLKTEKEEIALAKYRTDHFLRIGQRIKELRLTQDLSIKNFEELLSLPTGTMHNLEKGKGANPINLIAILTHFTSLGYSLKWLLEYDNDIHFKQEDQQVYLDIDKTTIIDIAEEIKLHAVKLEKLVSKYK